mmetsp:Transcript_104652/g.145917  ORF Transcript_104652/g.145917 Transcript_104652/m.145917 type:complete len:92 (-) Transcript_104652:100-375(-)|eukprot:symbB.v1.2.025599.t1/scaffold2482.1/size80432/5
MYKAIAVLLFLVWHPFAGAMLFHEVEEEELEEETSFMQVGMSKPVARPRRTGRTASAEAEEDEDSPSLFQSSMQKRGPGKLEDFESDEFSM